MLCSSLDHRCVPNRESLAALGDNGEARAEKSQFEDDLLLHRVFFPPRYAPAMFSEESCWLIPRNHSLPWSLTFPECWQTGQEKLDLTGIAKNCCVRF